MLNTADRSCGPHASDCLASDCRVVDCLPNGGLTHAPEDFDLRVTFAEAFPPREGMPVEFWVVGAERPFSAGAGANGVFKRGRFWSADGAEPFSPAEVVAWAWRGAGVAAPAQRTSASRAELPLNEPCF